MSYRQRSARTRLLPIAPWPLLKFIDVWKRGLHSLIHVWLSSAIKLARENEWVWQLQERLGNAYKTVRANTEQDMVRQKHYHNKKLNWWQFRELMRHCMCIFQERLQDSNIILVAIGVDQIDKYQMLRTKWILVSVNKLVIDVDKIRLQRSQTLVWEKVSKRNITERTCSGSTNAKK